MNLILIVIGPLQLATIAVVLNLLRETRKMANGFADLKQAVSHLTDALDDETAAIEAALSVISSGTASGAGAEAAALAIQSNVNNIKTETHKVNYVVKPPATPADGRSAS